MIHAIRCLSAHASLVSLKRSCDRRGLFMSRMRHLWRGTSQKRGGLANGGFNRMGVIFWGAGPDVDCAIGQTPSRCSTSAATTAATPPSPPPPPPRVSIFPRSLRDRNTPVHVSALASPVDGLLVLHDYSRIPVSPPLPQIFVWIDIFAQNFSAMFRCKKTLNQQLRN